MYVCTLCVSVKERERARARAYAEPEPEPELELDKVRGRERGERGGGSMVDGQKSANDHVPVLLTWSIVRPVYRAALQYRGRRRGGTALERCW